MLSVAFRSGLFKPWSVVLLMAGSEIASNSCFVGEGWLGLKASPPGPEDDATEQEIDRRLRRRGCLGASGMVFGVMATLTCLSPTTRIFRFVPLWLFVPFLVGSDVWDGYGTWQSIRARVRQDIEETKRSEVRSESKRDSADHAAHLAGAAFGVFFALLKWRLGSRL
ncbi:hypothetical protein PG996_007782 [Apiospora saccharicola]|uniref:Peptidase S54 rhomboid domain-containing protein n=1 Tax=Apiospora saccharicola TaxID=335842 RepID=A0ABR1UW50_9PEZI